VLLCRQSKQFLNLIALADVEYSPSLQEMSAVFIDDEAGFEASDSGSSRHTGAHTEFGVTCKAVVQAPRRRRLDIVEVRIFYVVGDTII
jgi:hypothetical protein